MSRPGANLLGPGTREIEQLGGGALERVRGETPEKQSATQLAAGALY